MANRKNKLLLSDLFPELAAEREVAEEEEREREEPARKVQKIRKNGRPMDLTKYEEKWNARPEVCKEWKRTKGGFRRGTRRTRRRRVCTSGWRRASLVEGCGPRLAGRS